MGTVAEISPGSVDGATDPLVALALTEDGERVDIVLKPTASWKHPRTRDVVPGEVLNVREVAAGLFLRAAGVPAPEPFIVIGSALPWDVLTAKHAGRLAAVPHFATRMIVNARECAKNERLERFANDALRTAAEDLFTADNILLNLDRTVAKPNLWWRHDALIPIDHGLAFYILTRDPDRVGIPQDYHRQHAAFAMLEPGQPRTFERSINAWIINLKATAIDAIERALPPEWIADRTELERIKRHLSLQPSRLDQLRAIIRFWFPSAAA